MTNHAPTPWKCAVKYRSIGGMFFEMVDAKGDYVFRVRGGTIPTDKDARFIVRAVNNFEPILKGLKMAVGRFTDILVTTGINSDEIRDALRDIITKAEEDQL